MQIVVADPFQRVLAVDLIARQAETLPIEIIPVTDEELVDEAIRTVEATLAPAGYELGRGAVDYCIRLLSAKRPDIDVLEGYAAILGDLPRDLLGKAVKACLAAATYHKLPPPGQFRDKIKHRLEERTSLLYRLKKYKTRLQLLSQRRAPSRPTPVEAGVGQSVVPKLRAI